jgi:Cof subfamily protein (haloacid dehalogenase superfamily)
LACRYRGAMAAGGRGGDGTGPGRPGVRLVASDLDGTLLRPDGTVSERTRAAIERVIAAGVTFVIVTGRPARSVREIAARAGVRGLAICANGALVYDLDADKVVAATPLTAEVGRRLVAELQAALPGTVFASETEDRFQAMTGWGRRSLPAPGRVEIDDPLALVAAPVIKLLVRHPERPFAELVERVRAVAGEDAVVTWSGVGLAEVSAAGVTKAFALEWVCRRLGVTPDQVVALGDMPNDLPMLVWAGRSVAVANADAEVVATADEVTAANTDDGVAIILERIAADPG